MKERKSVFSRPICLTYWGFVFNRTSNDKGEFDFDKDRYDIRIPSDVYEAMDDTKPHSVTSNIPESEYSLRVGSCYMHVLKMFFEF